MSSATVQKFWQKARIDAGLKKKLAAIQEKERQASIAAIVKLAAEAGFVFTAADYEAAVKEELARQHAAGTMSDEELAKVAGGRSGSGSYLGSIAGSIAT